MTIAIRTRGLTRTFRGVPAVNDISLDIEANTITGLLGRNGAGKTTFMSLVTAQDRPTRGTVEVDGRPPFEHAPVLERMCFLRDNQRYPDDYRLVHALRAASIFYPQWAPETADRLVALFRLPEKPVVKKFSRGQLSALGIVLGLASRSPLTFFDEPYLGLDATARGIFYDELLRDYTARPRTIIMSTHLINEMDQLLEKVIILDKGKVVRHADVEELRGQSYQVAGRAADVQEFLRGRHPLSHRAIGGFQTAVIAAAPQARDHEDAKMQRVELSSVSLQDLVAAYGVSADIDGITV